MISIWDNTIIKQARKGIDLSIRDAASALDITEEYLSMVENGHKQPSSKLILKMSRIYKRPLADFLKAEKNLVMA